MSRSQKKPPYIHPHLVAAVRQARKSGSKTPIKTRSRSSTIVPEMIGLTICVHNGKVYVPVLITDLMVNYKLGEFSITRTYKGHKNKDGDRKGGGK